MTRIVAHSRRRFLLDSAALIAAGATVPQFLARTATACAPGGTGVAPSDDRILVVVQLTGGNDGLNTVVPFRADAYYRARPTLGVPRGTVLKLNDDVGLHPQLRGLKSLHDDGLLTVLQGVGYPNPDRSHFSALDIWHCADPQRKRIDTGWLGRASEVAGDVKSGNQPHGPWAVHLDFDALPLALRGRHGAAPSIHDIASLKLDGDAAALRDVSIAARDAASDTLLYVQRAAVDACENARRLEKVLQDGPGEAAYPSTGLARKLKQIAMLIGADFGSRVYYTSLGGFDTHAKQAVVHGPLLAELGDALKAFFADLASRRLADRVLLMTFSEFGRRVTENGSQGTDHGAAAPMFLVGAAGRRGVIGDAPNFDNLIEGDVRHQIDFRGVYAALLEHYLQVNPRRVLGQAFSAPALLRP